MRKTIAIIIQVLIFTGTWFVTTNQIENNTWIFGFGDIETFKENIRWILLGAAGLSVLNILVWWPKAAKQTVAAAEGVNTKSAEAKEIDRDPKTPDLS